MRRSRQRAESSLRRCAAIPLVGGFDMATKPRRSPRSAGRWNPVVVIAGSFLVEPRKNASLRKPSLRIGSALAASSSSFSLRPAGAVRIADSRGSVGHLRHDCHLEPGDAARQLEAAFADHHFKSRSRTIGRDVTRRVDPFGPGRVDTPTNAIPGRSARSRSLQRWRPELCRSDS